jgi:hypothetical protein
MKLFRFTLLLLSLTASAQVKMSTGTNATAGTQLGGGAVGVTLAGVSIAPSSASVAINGTATFTATASYSDSSTLDVTLLASWSSSDPTIAAVQTSANPQPVKGLVTGSAQIIATYQGFSSAPATVTVTPLPLTITSTSCPNGTVGAVYTCQLTAVNGSTPYAWSIFAGSLPGWASLNTSTGAITGTPSAAASTNFTARVTDHVGATANQALTIGIITSGGVADDNYYDNTDGTCRNMGVNDGPAQLPQRCFNTLRANTPANVASRTICAGGGCTYSTIKAAFNAIAAGSEVCGTTFVVTPGTYEEVNLTYPAVQCNSTHWNWFQCGSLSNLPPEGTRITPAWAGIASLPGRPGYLQPGTPGTYTCKILDPALNQNSLAFTPATTAGGPYSSYVRWTGFYFAQENLNSAYCLSILTAKFNCTAWQAAIISTGCQVSSANCPDHIIIEQSLMSYDDPTGLGATSVQGGFKMAGTYIALIDSWTWNSQCQSSTPAAGNPGGVKGCPESHGVAFGTGAGPQNAIKVVNNFIESSDESMWMGGGGVDFTTPQDVEIRRNHLYKPYSIWMFGQPGYIGQELSVKNMAETKNLDRALFEGNTGDYNWQGQADQHGKFMSLNSVVQYPTNTYIDHTTNVTVRYNWFRHSLTGFNVGSESCGSNKFGCNTFPPGPPTPYNHAQSIHDNVFDDNSAKWQLLAVNNAGAGSTLELLNGAFNIPANQQLNSVKFDHNTIIGTDYDTRPYPAGKGLQIASIAVSGGVATLTATTNTAPITLIATTPFDLWGTSCAGFAGHFTIASVINQTPASGPVKFTYNTSATGSCANGYTSYWRAPSSAALQIQDNANDNPIATLKESGNTIEVVVNNMPGIIQWCVAVGNPSGCPSAAQFTVWNASVSGYNNVAGTFPHYTVQGVAYCSGAGAASTTAGSGFNVADCPGNGYQLLAANNPTSGLATDSSGNGYVSYWNNLGPNPNTIWTGITFTNNIVTGGELANFGGGVCNPVPCQNNSINAINSLMQNGGAGSWCIDHNVIADLQILGADKNLDVYPGSNPIGNACTSSAGGSNLNPSDGTYGTVGFNNFNWDNMSLGVTNLNDLALAPSSPYHNAGNDGTDIGANISNVTTYTTGVD